MFFFATTEPIVAMHEFSVCQSLIRKLAQISHENGDAAALCLNVTIGPLSGVEPQLLQQAFPHARIGTVAEQCELNIERVPIRVHCSECQLESAAEMNSLLCGQCGSNNTQLVSGDELLLESVEFSS
jgi:hydrogenase nickel incorporation protein HypA/HybF